MPSEDATGTRRQWRQVMAWVVTLLAFLLVLFALVAPNNLDDLTARAFLRVPLEGLLAVALALVLPLRVTRMLAVLVGAVLGVLIILKFFDMGFLSVLYRPFDPVLDWTFISAGVDYLTTTVGKFGAVSAVIGAVLLAIAVPALAALSALRLTTVVRRHRTGAIRATAALTVIWTGAAIFASPVASRSGMDYAYLHAKQIPAGIADERAFAKEAEVDAFRDAPGADLLKALRGKDVILTFVESYGRAAIEHPELAPEIGALLDAGTTRLRGLGYDARSAFLTSPTFGGGSWLAHATLDSGLWIDNQRRYRNLMSSDRLTINRAFQRAQWRTVGVEPAVHQAWPDGAFYGYDRIYTVFDLGYRGPRFSYATMPDQYILSAFHREERAAPGHAPVMAQITTLSSHAPWEPIPRVVDWHDIGDGSVYAGMSGAESLPEDIFQRATSRVRADYGRAIVYALTSLLSYVETYGGDNLVLVFLGDHQPAPVVTGEGAPRDVPITIVAHDPAVLDRISGWGWDSGLKPGPRAPVWRMNEFRDRFLSAFG